MDNKPEEQKSAAENLANLAALLDVQMAVSIQFGETEMLLEDVIKLGVGSIIELNSGVDEPVKLIVNGSCFARGEVVTVDAFYGIKITEITSVTERIKSFNA